MTKPDLLRTGTIRPVTFHKYERYLPTAFDESLSILEKINKMIHYLNEIGELTNEMIEKWNAVYDWVLNEGLEAEVSLKLDAWLADGTLGEIVEDTLTRIIQEMEALIARMEAYIEEVKQQEYVLDLSRATNTFLYEFDLEDETINQSIVIDEQSDYIYATQVNLVDEDGGAESYRINRLDRLGRLIDSMRVRLGGHGTSIGLEYDNGIPYIWGTTSDSDYTYVSRFRYAPGTEITGQSAGVESYMAYQGVSVSVVIDDKNKLAGIRTTEVVNGGNVTHFNVYNIADLKNRINEDTPVYSYAFTDGMNAQGMQGNALDGHKFYVTFGMSAAGFSLYEVDLRTGEVVHNLTGKDMKFAPIETEDYSEPEGLFLYTDPTTKKKILFHVLMTDNAGRRRKNLYALSSSHNAVEPFIGYANRKAQQYAFIRNDGKGIRRYELGEPANLSDIRKPGWYYFNAADMAEFADHPIPESGGYWLLVSPTDTGTVVHHTMIRNSAVHSHVLTRTIFSDGTTSPFSGVDYKVTEFSNGFHNYYEDGTAALSYHKEGNTLHITGIIAHETAGTTGEIFTLPAGYCPAKRQHYPILVDDGIAEIQVSTSGAVTLASYPVGGTSTTYIHLNLHVSMI